MGVQEKIIKINETPPKLTPPNIIDSGHHNRLDLRLYLGGGSQWCFCYYGMLLSLLKKMETSSDPEVANAHISVISATSGGSQAGYLLGNNLNSGMNTIEALRKTLTQMDTFQSVFKAMFPNEIAFFQYAAKMSAKSFWHYLRNHDSYDPVTHDLMRLIEKTGTHEPSSYTNTQMLINSTLVKDDGTIEPHYHVNRDANLMAVAASSSLTRYFRGIKTDKGVLRDGGYTHNPVLKETFNELGMTREEARSGYNIAAFVSDPIILAKTEKPEKIVAGKLNLLSSQQQVTAIREMIEYCGSDRFQMVSMFDEKRPCTVPERTKMIFVANMIDLFAKTGEAMGHDIIRYLPFNGSRLSSPAHRHAPA